jgi:hypothetical protein
MKQENRLIFYLVWHLIAGMVIAFSLVFILYGFSMGRNLNFWEEIWRTINYGLIIVPTSAFISVLSMWMYGLIYAIGSEDHD